MELKPDWQEQWHTDPGHITALQNDRIYSILSAVFEEMRMNEMETRVESPTELDSHANMPVVGKHAYIIAETGKKVDVSPFTRLQTAHHSPGGCYGKVRQPIRQENIHTGTM